MTKRLIPILKVVFAAAILTWMIRSGKLDLSQVARGLSHWPSLVAIAALIGTQVGITVCRWKLLLRAQDFTIGFREALRFTMIGMLFNVVIPGAVGGDVMKAYYVTRRAPDRKAEAAGTILMDRVVGLVALLLLSAVAALWNIPSVLGRPALLGLCTFAVAGAAGGVSGLLLAVNFGSRLAVKNPSGRLAVLLSRLLAGLDGYRRHAATLPATIGMSVICHLIACLIMYLALESLGAPRLPPHYFFLVIPLGLLTTAVPVSPAGIGVGQAAFFSLFQMVSSNPAAGASAFTVYQTLLLLIYLTGFYPYLSHKAVTVPEATPVAAP